MSQSDRQSRREQKKKRRTASFRKALEMVRMERNSEVTSPTAEMALTNTFSETEKVHFVNLYERMMEFSFEKSFECYLAEPKHFRVRDNKNFL